MYTVCRKEVVKEDQGIGQLFIFRVWDTGTADPDVGALQHGLDGFQAKHRDQQGMSCHDAALLCGLLSSGASPV